MSVETGHTVRNNQPTMTVSWLSTAIPEDQIRSFVKSLTDAVGSVAGGAVRIGLREREVNDGGEIFSPAHWERYWVAKFSADAEAGLDAIRAALVGLPYLPMSDQTPTPARMVASDIVIGEVEAGG